MLFDVTPGTASAGTPFTIRGQGLPTATSSVTVWIGSATCSVSTASADGTWVTATVPAMATGSYQMEVDIGQWANRTLSFVVQ